jgi:hypothetical protein
MQLLEIDDLHVAYGELTGRRERFDNNTNFFTSVA